eukprot:3138071-Amphidinium_carterae.2
MHEDDDEDPDYEVPIPAEPTWSDDTDKVPFTTQVEWVQCEEHLIAQRLIVKENGGRREQKGEEQATAKAYINHDHINLKYPQHRQQQHLLRQSS